MEVKHLQASNRGSTAMAATAAHARARRRQAKPSQARLPRPASPRGAHGGAIAPGTPGGGELPRTRVIRVVDELGASGDNS
jgi:hypothetical protein